MAKSQKMLKVRHKVSGVEREMTEASYKNLKRHYDVLGVVGEDGELNPTSPQQTPAKSQQGAKVVAIGNVPAKQPDPEILETSEEDPGEIQETDQDQVNDQEGKEDSVADAPVLGPEAIPGAETPTKPVVDVSNITQTTTPNPAASGKSRTASDIRKTKTTKRN